MQVLEEVPVEVKYGKQTRTLTLVVFAGNGMGRDWLEQIQLAWRKIDAVVTNTYCSVINTRRF